MAIQLGSAYGKVSLDVNGLKNAVKQGREGLFSLASAGEQIGESLKNVGTKLTIGLTLPIAALGAASIKASSDFEETRNKAVVVFEEMGDAVVANARKAGTALGISQTQYLDYASSIGAALKAGGLGIAESTALSEAAVKHFADLASFHNSRVEDVATAWQSAIRGQYEPIQRFFPFITNQFLITYGTANGLIDANTKQLTANQRAIILNAIALNEELNPALDDFSETSGGLANQTRIMQAQWQNALILLGQNLLPVALQFVNALNSMLERFNALTPVQQKIILGFLGFLAILGPLLSAAGTVISIVSSISGALGVLSTAGISLGGIGTTIATVAVPAVAALGSALLPILAILASIILIVGVLAVAWRTNFLGIRDIINTSVRFWTNILQAFFAFLRGDTDAAMEHLQEAWSAIMEHIEKVFGRLEGIRNAWLNFLRWIQNAITDMVRFISNAFSRIDWGELGRFLVMGIANGILGGIPALVTAAIDAADAALDAIKERLGISSPSKAFEQLGKFSAQGYQLGLAKAMTAEDIARTMARPVNNLSNSQQQNLTLQLANGVTIRQVREIVSENNDQIMNTLSNFFGAA